MLVMYKIVQAFLAAMPIGKGRLGNRNPYKALVYMQGIGTTEAILFSLTPNVAEFLFTYFLIYYPIQENETCKQHKRIEEN